MNYTHIATGVVNSKERWILSYPEEELAERGLTAEEAFAEDENIMLIRMEEK